MPYTSEWVISYSILLIMSLLTLELSIFPAKKGAPPTIGSANIHIIHILLAAQRLIHPNLPGLQVQGMCEHPATSIDK